MKKTYVKPSIYTEEFTLSEHIAKGCDSQNINKPDDTLINTRDSSCTYDIDGVRYFSNGNTDRCDWDPADIFGDDGCYEGALLTGSITFFLS